MKFSIHHRVDSGEGWFIGERTKTIRREGYLDSSTKYSKILCVSDGRLSESYRKKCYKLVPREKIEGLEAAWEATATTSSSNLFGPASLMNGVIVYPCTQFKCRICCSCNICREKNLQNESETKTSSLEEHRIYHKAWHNKCDFCTEIYSIIPMYRVIIFENDGSLYGKDYPHDQGIFQHHNMVSRESKTSKLECELCDLVFTRIENKIRHYMSIHTEDSYSCDQCNEVFNRKDKLKCHIEDVHEFVTRCKACKTEFTSIKNLDRHVDARYDADGTPIHKCDVCDKVLCSQRFLNKHMKKHLVSCDDCGEIFSRVTDLARHMNRTNVKCDQCSLIFCNSKKLMTHRLKLHHQIKKCDYCGEIFSKEYNLQRHMKRKHQTSS